jgi:mRNA interferase RelE/StbE
MEVKYHSSFDKDLEGITQSHVKKAVLKVIMRAKSAKHLGEIPHCEKLKGYRNAYRVRIGEFRIGVFSEESVIRPIVRISTRYFRDVYLLSVRNVKR